jgi:hypothetical protein
LVAFKQRQKPPKWDQKEGQKGPRPIEKIPKNTIFQHPIQKNSFSENFTWVEAVRKNLPAELFIFGSYFPPMVLYARAQLNSQDHATAAVDGTRPVVETRWDSLSLPAQQQRASSVGVVAEESAVA